VHAAGGRVNIDRQNKNRLSAVGTGRDLMLNSTNAGNAMAAQTGDLKWYRDFPGRGAE
jgi:hypothetical protein